jgi:hypothetical protein
VFKAGSVTPIEPLYADSHTRIDWLHEEIERLREELRAAEATLTHAGKWAPEHPNYLSAAADRIREALA